MEGVGGGRGDALNRRGEVAAWNAPRPQGRASCEAMPGDTPGAQIIGARRSVKTRDQLRGALRAARRCTRAARRCVRRLMPRVPPPVAAPAFGSCSGGASGGDAWASASDTVSTVTSAGAAARLSATNPRRESAFRREVTSDGSISDLHYRTRVKNKTPSDRPRGSVACWYEGSRTAKRSLPPIVAWAGRQAFPGPVTRTGTYGSELPLIGGQDWVKATVRALAALDRVRPHQAPGWQAAFLGKAESRATQPGRSTRRALN